MFIVVNKYRYIYVSAGSSADPRLCAPGATTCLTRLWSGNVYQGAVEARSTHRPPCDLETIK